MGKGKRKRNKGAAPAATTTAPAATTNPTAHSGKNKNSKRQKRKTGRDRKDEGVQQDTGPLWAGGVSKAALAQWKKMHACILDKKKPADGNNVRVEVLRYSTVSSLRDRLQRLCGKGTATSRYPSLGFERWLLNAKARESAADVRDPVVPSTLDADEVLVGDLTKLGFSATQAATIATTIASEASTAATKLAQEGERKGGAGGDEFHVRAKTAEDGTVSFSVKALPKVVLAIASCVHSKLAQLHAAYSTTQDKKNGTPDRKQKEKKAGRGGKVRLARDMFCVLLRYHTISGPGFQAGLPATTFAFLQEHLGVDTELFASPLNCYYPLFCSAFPDVDGPFGGVASFFSFAPSSGSFEANPPFAPLIMNKMVSHIHTLLRKATGPLSFAVVVPVWSQLPFWDALVASPCYRGKVLLSKVDHVWRQAGSSASGCVSRRIPCDTAVVFLQNEEGAGKWLVCPETLTAMQATMQLEARKQE